MKKNGFTLIEILVVIVLLAAVSVTVGINMNNMFNKEKDKNYNSFIAQIEDAACVYAETNNIKVNAVVSTSELINEGLINKNLKNPKTGNTIETEEFQVNITWQNYERKCKIKTS